MDERHCVVVHSKSWTELHGHLIAINVQYATCSDTSLTTVCCLNGVEQHRTHQ